MRSIGRLAALTLLTLSPLATAEEGSSTDGPPSTWPQWRGPGGHGVARESVLPLRWSATQNVLWKTPIPGRGHSSPIVWGDRLFLTTALEGETVPEVEPVRHVIAGKPFEHPDGVAGDVRTTLKVLALDNDSGTVLWERTAYVGTVYDTRHRKNTRASETPATDGRHVFAYFGSGGLYAYTLDGDLRWKRSIADIGTYGVGTGSSPVLHEGLLILQVDNEDGERSFLLALDKETGKEVWKVERKVSVGWATPILAATDGRAELVTSGNEQIVAYDPADGRELWRAAGLASNAVPSPVTGDGRVFLSSGFPQKRVVAIRLGGRGDLTGSDRILWEYGKGTGYIPSPVLYGRYLYLVNDGGVLTCLEAASGEVVYEGNRVPLPGTIAASLVAWDDKLLVFNTKGDGFVLRAGPQPEVLATNSVGEPVWATPAIADSRLFVRGETTLFAIGRAPGDGTAATASDDDPASR